MNEGKFTKGAVYYQCGTLAHPYGTFGISMWVYEGHVHTVGKSDAACDKPYSFYRFHDYEGWALEQTGETGRVIKLDIPSMVQAQESMLTWQELLARIKGLKE
jgi:hypothetical protein